MPGRDDPPVAVRTLQPQRTDRRPPFRPVLHHPDPVDGSFSAILPALKTDAMVAVYMEDSRLGSGHGRGARRGRVTAASPWSGNRRPSWNCGSPMATRCWSAMSHPDARRSAAGDFAGHSTDVQSPVLARVYSVAGPDLGQVDITGELRITPASCGRTLRLETVYSAGGDRLVHGTRGRGSALWHGGRHSAVEESCACPETRRPEVRSGLAVDGCEGRTGGALRCRAFVCQSAVAQDVTLVAREGGIVLTGTLQGYDGEFYRIDTSYGTADRRRSGGDLRRPGLSRTDRSQGA